MANAILHRVVSNVQESLFFGIIVDETADVSQIEQMFLCLRSVNKDVNIHEYFVGLYSLQKCTSAAIMSAIKDVMLRFSLLINNCRSQCFDGAASMSGQVSGVAKTIRDEESRVISTHCYMHSLSLAVQESVAAVPLMQNFLQFVQELILFIRNSPKRGCIVCEVAEKLECTRTHIRPLWSN